jgi:hypothetical protein
MKHEAAGKDGKKWEKFERLVAAIHRLEMKGAVIKWNDKINGRQFDVTVRFESGPYKYLTVIECKNYTLPVKAEKIDSLVTKAKDAGADKAVMFSACGFQSGAIEVAKRHCIPLFSLSQLDHIPDEMLAPEFMEYIQVYDVVIVQPDGVRYLFPEESMKLHYYINETIINNLIENISISKLIRFYENKLDGRGLDDVLDYGVKFEPFGVAIFPKTERKKPILVHSVCWRMVNRVGRPLKEPRGLDPAIFTTPYQIKDELSGNVRYIKDYEIQDDNVTSVVVERFYRLRNIGIYYCDEICNDIAQMIMLESYQHGRFIQVVFTARLEDICGYVEVTDVQELDRLRWRLEQFRTMEKANQKIAERRERGPKRKGSE